MQRLVQLQWQGTKLRVSQAREEPRIQKVLEVMSQPRSRLEELEDRQ
jgi:hypothetical protein